MTMDKLPIGAGTLALCCLSTSASWVGAATAGESLFQHCSSVRDDDELRGYDPSLREVTIEAFRKLAPNVKAETDGFEAQAQYRCMDGKVMVCFVGANLPCAKINRSEDNSGANAACIGASDGATVPAAAAGHDSAYAFICRGGRAVVDHQTWKLDKRGFAQAIWTAVRER
jgi:hypothetical protein